MRLTGTQTSLRICFNMMVFGKRYFKTRNDHIFPLIQYKFPENKLEFNNFKNNLKLVKTANVSGNNKFTLTFNEDQLIKGLIGDIEYYHARTLVQYANLIRSFRYVSQCWNIVSQYYFSFFSATTCLRLLHRGNTYLNDSYAKELTEIIQILSGEVVKLNPGNYTFQIFPIPGSSDLNLEYPYQRMVPTSKRGLPYMNLLRIC